MNFQLIVRLFMPKLAMEQSTAWRKLSFFFFYPWFLLSEGSEPFCLKHKRCTVREANGLICPDRMFFSSSLFLIFPMRFTGKKILNWYLTLFFCCKNALRLLYFPRSRHTYVNMLRNLFFVCVLIIVIHIIQAEAGHI